MDQAYVVSHYWEGSADIEAVFNVESDARSYIDRARKSYGARLGTHEWEVLAVPLNPD